MKHVVTRPFTTFTRTRLRASYARQPLLQPAILPLFCSLTLALFTVLLANGGGPLFVLGILGILACLVWTLWRCAKRAVAFAQDYVSTA